MESIVFKAFQVVFKTVAILMLSGTLATAFMDLHRNAFNSKSVGLTSMLKVNQQLVGKIK